MSRVRSLIETQVITHRTTILPMFNNPYKPIPKINPNFETVKPNPEHCHCHPLYHQQPIIYKILPTPKPPTQKPPTPKYKFRFRKQGVIILHKTVNKTVNNHIPTPSKGGFDHRLMMAASFASLGSAAWFIYNMWKKSNEADKLEILKEHSYQLMQMKDLLENNQASADAMREEVFKKLEELKKQYCGGDKSP